MRPHHALTPQNAEIESFSTVTATFLCLWIDPWLLALLILCPHFTMESKDAASEA
jgi:hypothetical protein